MLGFFAVIRKIYTHLLSAAGTLLTRFRGTTAPKQPRAISSSVKRTSALRETEAPGFPAIPLEKAVLPSDVEAQLAAVNWDRRDVLVGTLRNAAQLKACLDGRFYYIPAALVTEEDKPIHYVALFQTPRVFPGHAGIFWYGAVQRSALVERGSILEVPQTHGSPDAPYYRYQICQWLPLPTPIRPREAGFVRAFTNLFLLENAEFIPELLLGSEEEYRLFLELKRRPRGAAGGYSFRFCMGRYPGAPRRREYPDVPGRAGPGQLLHPVIYPVSLCSLSAVIYRSGAFPESWSPAAPCAEGP